MWKKLTDNWPMMLAALALAVPVWFYANSVVTGREDVKVYFDVSYPSSVEVQVVPADRWVKLEVRGPAAVIKELSRRNVQILYKVPNVDLRADRTDTTPFDPKMVVNLPAEAQVVSFSPASFTLTVRPVETWSLPVKIPKIVTRPAPGYVAEAPEIRGSDRASVTGPVTVLRRLRDEFKGVETEPVDVTNHTEPIRDRKLRIETRVVLDNATVEQVHCDDMIDVFVDIHRATSTRVVRDVPVSVLTTPGAAVDVEITSGNPVSLSVEGPPDAVAALTAAQLNAFIDVRGRRPETEKDVPFQERVLVQGLPEGVRLAEPVHATARFKLPGRPPEKAVP